MPTMIRLDLVARRLHNRLPVSSDLIVSAQSMNPPAVAVEDPDMLDVFPVEVGLLPTDSAGHKRQLVLKAILLAALLDELPATSDTLLGIEESCRD